ncbi:hypothetical protein SAMN06265795_105200 [Noviherbaspirillum humi]|uniref:HTH cro/C1-type domain-containing protein n=1 Tax=Noviherbaspirillum humi TaxID=1688639 RepID=A0A239GUA3_9BURK|nr:helix-turn-helix transcriptional regulator [Noviherbaspirillum humi]SNS72789.1 hypothetical protein SAMN06265795_105200 [Noviherbaspirillum humi]
MQATTHTYNPAPLLDMLRSTLNAPNDAVLARMLGLSPAAISKIRNQHVPVSSAVLLQVHEITGISIRELRNLIGDTSTNLWESQRAWIRPAGRTVGSLATR